MTDENMTEKKSRKTRGPTGPKPVLIVYTYDFDNNPEDPIVSHLCTRDANKVIETQAKLYEQGKKPFLKRLTLDKD